MKEIKKELTEQEILDFITNDRTSEKKRFARIGQKYYEGDGRTSNLKIKDWMNALIVIKNYLRVTKEQENILEVLRSDYIRTAKAKGLKQSQIMYKHVLKGAMLPVVSYLGPAFAGIITVYQYC